MIPSPRPTASAITTRQTHYHHPSGADNFPPPLADPELPSTIFGFFSPYQLVQNTQASLLLLFVIVLGQFGHWLRAEVRELSPYGKIFYGKQEIHQEGEESVPETPIPLAPAYDFRRFRVSMFFNGFGM